MLVLYEGLNAEFVEDLDEFLVEGLVSANALREGNVDNLVVAHAHQDVTLTLQNGPEKICLEGF